MKKYIQYFLFLSCLALFSCGIIDAETNMTQAVGDGGEIFLFMDSAKWKGELGAEIREIFSVPLDCVMPAERIFTVRCIDPLKMNKLLRNHKNIIFVTSFDGESAASRKLKEYFPQEAKEKIKTDSSFFMFSKKDQYAKGQVLLHLFGKNDQELIANLKKNRQKLRDLYNQVEIERATTRLLNSVNEGLMEDLKKTHQIDMKILTGYQLALSEKSEDEKTGFVWYRLPEAILDKDIFIAYKPYVSEKQFDKDSVIAWRNQICQKYMHDDPEKPDTYIITETLEPPVSRAIKVKGKYIVETRGLWKTKNISMGGSFISYVFTDQKGRLYYIEGFVYAPDRGKREIIREFEVILNTFKE